MNACPTCGRPPSIQQQILAIVRDARTGITSQEIRARLGRGKSNISSVASKLADYGFITRRYITLPANTVSGRQRHALYLPREQ